MSSQPALIKRDLAVNNNIKIMKTVFDITPANAFEPELRALYLGGTDVAAVCGVSDYKTPFEVYLEKTGQVVPDQDDDNPLFKWGHLLEPVIANQWIVENPEWEIISANEFSVDPIENFLCRNTDRRIRHKVTGEIAVLEVKTVASSAFKHWKLGVPVAYYTQGQHYLSVGGEGRMFFALFVMDSRDLQTLEVIRDDKFIDEMNAQCIKFWTDSVIGGIEPEKTASDWGKKQSLDVSVEATPEIVKALEDLKEAKAAEKLAKENGKAAAETIQVFLGENSILTAPGDPSNYLVTWNGQNTTRAVSTKIIKELAPALYDQLTNTSYGRVLRIKGEK